MEFFLCLIIFLVQALKVVREEGRFRCALSLSKLMNQIQILRVKTVRASPSAFELH